MKPIPAVLLGFVIFLIIGQSLPFVFAYLGESAYKKQNYVAAYRHLSTARTLAPKNSEFKYKYVLTMSKLKPTISVQKQMFEISEEPKEDSAVYAAKQQITNWNKQVLMNYGSTYIEQAPFDSKILRWNPSTFPLKFSIEGGADIPEYYKTEIGSAFKQWQDSTGFLKFTAENTLRNANIVVKFMPLPKNNCDSAGCKYVVAYTEPEIKAGQLKKMTITMYERDAMGNYFSDRELYNTILHEIGHALGLMGHSYSTEDVMYMASTAGQNNIFARYRSSFQYISSIDLNTIRLLYNLTPDITNTDLSKLNTEGLLYAPVVLGGTDKITKRKIKEAEAYIKKALELPNGYIDLAAAYAEQQNVKKAEQNLKMALKYSRTNDEQYLVYYNLAVVYLNNNMPKEALAAAEQAKQISATEEIAELIGNIEHAIATKRKPFKS